MYARTDLAMEEQELWRRSAGEQTELSGVWARTNERRGIRTTVVKILDENGVRQLRKPVGTYLTLELGALALVAGLGNDAVTPDAVGTLTLRSLIVTRHLKSARLAGLEGFRDVSAVQPGVLGTTGVESVELVRGAAERVRPQMVLVVDALAAREPERVCTTVQLADSGIVPGYGVGNSRAAFNEQTLGVPVLAIGVPTVVDAAGLADESGKTGNFHNCISGMVVTPRDIDARVREIARLIGYSIDLALHRGLTLEEIPCFLA